MKDWTLVIIVLILFGVLVVVFAQPIPIRTVELAENVTARRIDPNTIEITTVLKDTFDKPQLLSEKENLQKTIVEYQRRIDEIDVLLNLLN